MHKLDINIKNLSKIEGHTHLDVKVIDGKVTESKLKVSENKRFFTYAVEGMKYNLVPTTLSRICGTCSAAHTLCAIEAIEKALNIKPTKQTMILRNLLMHSDYIRDHTMHLYFFCLPDILHKDSVLDFNKQEHQWIHDALEIKEAGNYLSKITGGRAIHPPNAVIGGFTKFPTKEELKEAKTKLKKCRDKILKITEIFYNDKTSFQRKTNYVGLINDDYNFLEGIIKTAKGTLIQEKDFKKHLQKVVLPYSLATGFTWESQDFMVGALARINLNKNNLHKNTKKDTKKYLKVFPSNCIFNNNLAQAIETLHSIDTSINLIESLEKSIKPEKPIIAKAKKSIGVGVVEAPRGTLYHKIELNEKGIVVHADVCIPTQQNIIHLEKDIAKYVEELLKQGKNKKKITFEIEKMIRAYDPCMSCATHFLKINWKEN